MSSYVKIFNFIGILLLGVGAFSPEELVVENGTSLADFSKVNNGFI